ncbi:MAG: hypothetical protein V7727_16550 [Sneathiella sp.]
MNNSIIDIKKIDRAAFIRAEEIVPWLLLDEGGHCESRSLPSVKFNYQTGGWYNNRTGSSGTGVISLYADLKEVSAYEAAIRIARCLGGLYV